MENVTRMISPHFTETWGQQIVVDDRRGADGIIRHELAAKAAPESPGENSAGWALGPSIRDRVAIPPRVRAGEAVAGDRIDHHGGGAA